MSAIDIGYLHQTFDADGWWAGGLNLTFEPGENTYSHPDLDEANDPQGNLLLVVDPLKHQGVELPQYSQDFQDYLDGRSLFKMVLRPLQDIALDLAALTSKQRGKIEAWLLESVPWGEGNLYRWMTSGNEALWASAQSLGGAGSEAVLTTTAALWCREHPRDFVNPPYDPSINIPGAEPA